jgi:hypothetical protein
VGCGHQIKTTKRTCICPLIFMKKKKGAAELHDCQSYQHHQFLAIVELNQDTH